MGSPSYDVLLDLCRDRHRRIVLGTLAEERRTLTLRDLATAVLTNDHNDAITEAADEDLEEIRCSLYHVHLPKLESAGLVEHDPERKTVAPTERFDRIEPTLSRILAADPALELPIAQ